MRFSPGTDKSLLTYHFLPLYFSPSARGSGLPLSGPSCPPMGVVLRHHPVWHCDSTTLSCALSFCQRCRNAPQILHHGPVSIHPSVNAAARRVLQSGEIIWNTGTAGWCWRNLARHLSRISNQTAAGWFVQVAGWKSPAFLKADVTQTAVWRGERGGRDGSDRWRSQPFKARLLVPISSLSELSFFLK